MANPVQHSNFTRAFIEGTLAVVSHVVQRVSLAFDRVQAKVQRHPVSSFAERNVEQSLVERREIQPQAFLAQHQGGRKKASEERMLQDIAGELARCHIQRPCPNWINGKSLLEHLEEVFPEQDFRGPEREKVAQQAIPEWIRRMSEDSKILITTFSQLLWLVTPMPTFDTPGYAMLPAFDAQFLTQAHLGAAIDEGLVRDAGLAMRLDFHCSEEGELSFSVQQQAPFTLKMGEMGDEDLELMNKIPSYFCHLTYDSVTCVFQKVFTVIDFTKYPSLAGFEPMVLDRDRGRQKR